jgi:hypothetical protein
MMGALAPLLGLLLGGSGAAAQERPIVVVVEGDGAAVPAEALREAVGRELGAPALAPADPQAAAARGTLTVQLVDAAPAPGAAGERRLVVVYRDAGGREVWRSIAVPGDPVGAIATIALLAGNLARDEAGELLAQLGRSAQAPAIVAEPAPAPVIVPAPEAPAPIVILPHAPAEPARALAAAAPVDQSSPVDAPFDPYEDAWNVSAALGYTVDLRTKGYGRVEVAGTYRWGGPLALGLALTVGGNTSDPREPDGDGVFEPVSLYRTALLALIEHRSVAGPFWLDVGAGLGGLIFSAQSAEVSYSDLVPHARLQGTLAWAFAGGADLFARADLTTTFEDLDAGHSLRTSYGMFDATFAAGLRGRL